MKQMSIIFFVLLCCSIALIIAFNDLADLPVIKTSSATTTTKSITETPEYIYEIGLPEGYKKIPMPEGSFGEWLQQVKLRKDNTVYLYNGNPKPNQSLHYAVLDFSTGNKDLQQCADAIMRLRAEYYFSRKEYSKIDFKSAQKNFNFQQWLNLVDNSHEKDYHVLLLQFMQDVFINCGTYTVDAMTKKIAMKEMQPGDVFVKAGAPGHAMIVVDVAANEMAGKKIYLLAQSFMPAQDIHIVINPDNSMLSPWYAINDEDKIVTPGWVFEKTQLKRF